MKVGIMFTFPVASSLRASSALAWAASSALAGRPGQAPLFLGLVCLIAPSQPAFSVDILQGSTCHQLPVPAQYLVLTLVTHLPSPVSSPFDLLDSWLSKAGWPLGLPWLFISPSAENLLPQGLWLVSGHSSAELSEVVSAFCFVFPPQSLLFGL